VSAQAAVAPVTMQRMLPPEEAARGDFYALLAGLLMTAPSATLLAQIAAAGPIEGDPALARAWQGLTDASKAMDADAAAYEYDELFAAVGKAPVSIYAGYYLGAPAIDHPRVRLQAELAALGLARTGRASEPEDHLGGLFEVMRVLVAGAAGRKPSSLAEQKRFYQAYLERAAAAFFAALAVAPQANYYRHAAAVGAAFVALESQSFLLA
jgi:TorA maturation chaperone TorD